MLDFLKKSYPFNDDLKRNAKVIFFISISIFVFLLVFQPLEISALDQGDKIYLIVGLGAITFLSLSVNLLVLPSMVPQLFLYRRWTIWKEILWDLWLLFTIAFGYFVMYKFLGIVEFSFNMMLQMLLIAIIPLTALIVFNHNRLLRQHLKTAYDLNSKLRSSKNAEDKLVHFDSEYQKDKLSIKTRLLVLVRAADNYIEVFWKDDGIIKSQLIRSTLLKTQTMLEDYNYFFKCHRSYIVNINYIDRVEGNSQGYRLFFENLNFGVPVSKPSIKELKERVKFL
ncbi:MAG: LytTR family DNA-binding domain-containing protein [Salinivirgaceae bacterium]